MLLGFRFLFVLSLASAFLKISKTTSRFTPLHSASSSSSDISKLKPPTNAFAYSAISIIKQGFFDILLPLPKKEISLTADDSDSAMTPILRQSLIRFFVLETIARTPYFAYLSVLHLLETLGIDRQLKEGNNVELMRVHFAEGINEGVHLKIVEEILARIDDEMKLLPPKMIKNDDGTTTPEKPPGEEYKFLARGVSVVWYWTVCVLYLANPNLAYEFNEAVERHAYETYDGFTKDFKEYLERQPAVDTANDYYSSFIYDEMNVSNLMEDCAAEKEKGMREKCKNLYDVFCNIRDDEGEHVKAMLALEDMVK